MKVTTGTSGEKKINIEQLCLKILLSCFFFFQFYDREKKEYTSIKYILSDYFLN